jgi:hypothetical protein
LFENKSNNIPEIPILKVTNKSGAKKKARYLFTKKALEIKKNTNKRKSIISLKLTKKI